MGSKLGISILSLLSFQVYAQVCICQYAVPTTRHGYGIKAEVPAYKAGCIAWLATQLDCHKRKMMDSTEPLKNYLDEKITYIKARKNKIKVGFVGHWRSSRGMTRYLDEEILPLINKYKSSFEIENTACNPMDDPELVFDHISKYKMPAKTYLRVKGPQTISIGVWDLATPILARADVNAIADTRYSGVLYPKCKSYINKICTGRQFKEQAYCLDDKKERKIISCLESKQTKYIKLWQLI